MSSPLITGIGSLPHPSIDTALHYSFRFTLPFLPQIPKRNPWEYMIPQALHGLPGLEVEPDGTCYLNLPIWSANSKEYADKLKSGANFEPTPASYSCWDPFVWELEERKIKQAKIQLAGPLTCQWVLRDKMRQGLEHQELLMGQILRLVCLRSLSMVERLQKRGIKPLFFIDEPGLYALEENNPRHQTALMEVKLFVQMLKKAGAEVGLHCCSQTHWAEVLGLGIDILSIDCGLSLKTLLKETAAIQKFKQSGGRFAFGVIPTLKEGSYHESSERMLNNFLEMIHYELPENSILTPACGLALHTLKDSETILGMLQDFSVRLGKRADSTQPQRV